MLYYSILQIASAGSRVVLYCTTVVSAGSRAVTTVYYSSLGWQPCCTIIVYYSCLGWQPCCTIVYYNSLGRQPYCTYTTIYYSSLGWQPCCTIVYFSNLGWQQCCTIVYYSCLGWQPCCTIVYYSSLGWQPCCTTVSTAASAGSRVPYITIFCSTLKLIIRRDSDLLKYIKFSLNGVIDYSSILKFVFYKIFFTIRTTDTYQFLSNKFM